MWWLFGEETLPDIDNRPWWVAGSVSVVAVGYMVVRFYYWVRNRSKEFQDQRQATTQAQQVQARREAAQEAWEVVDRLTKQVDSHDEKLKELDKKHDDAMRDCEERERRALDRAAEAERREARISGRLSIIEAWARKKGMPIPDEGQSGMQSRAPSPQPDNES